MKQVEMTRKVPGGKLFRIELTADDRIQSVKITGDFFLHPEETLAELEACLVGLALPLQADIITQTLQAVLDQSGALLVGLTPADLAAAMVEMLA